MHNYLTFILKLVSIPHQSIIALMCGRVEKQFNTNSISKLDNSKILLGLISRIYFFFFLTYFLLSSLLSPSFLGLDRYNVGHLSYAAELMLGNVLACRAYLFRFVVETLSLNCFGESRNLLECLARTCMF